MKVLVTGGTGFIGSHTAVELINAGHQIVIVDNLYNSSADVIDRIETITGVRPPFINADLADKDALRAVFRENSFDAVIHFAGYKAVGESVRKPLEYYKNNIGITISLVECMEEFGCSRIIFSSSATVYGPNNPAPYVETMPALESTNPYGRTKLMIEQILRDYCFAHPEFTAVLLRYFNPIGAHESGLLGDDPSGIPNNLMPYLSRVAAGQLEKLTVFGDDYPTPDGSCLRDYLHVVDLAKGHIKAMEYAMNHTGAEAFNLGTGNGVSVLELIAAFEKATGAKVPFVIGARREGDLAANWADASKAEKVLGWKAEKTIEDMCRDSWNFVNRRKAELEGK